MARPERIRSDQPADDMAPSEEAIRGQLDRIVGSADFG